MMIFTGFTSYQSQVEFNELSSKIDELKVVNKENQEEKQEDRNTKLDSLATVTNEAYLKGIKPIEINKENILESIKEVEKVDGLISSEIKEANNIGQWNFGDIYKVVTVDNKSYTIRTHENKVYGIIDDTTNKEKVIMEEEKFENILNIQNKQGENETDGTYDYIEYAVRFENPDASENVTETVPHYVGFYIFKDVDRTNEKFMSKITKLINKNGVNEAYIYDNIEVIEQDIVNGYMDTEGYDIAPNASLHYTSNKVTK